MDRFYADLPAFTDFADFSAFEAYQPFPDDWVVLCGDIRGSTQAIADGRYKDVNMVGAAVITAVLNTCPGLQLPYVFGGDGGLVVVPASAAGPASVALRRLQAHAERTFGLGLRAAAVPVSRLRAEGQDLTVRKFELSPGNPLAMLAGGGADHADRILKEAAPDDPSILTPGPDVPPPDLEGLSCRWEPLAAARGHMVALMVQPADGRAADAYHRILEGIGRALDGGMQRHAPASRATLRFRWPPRGLLIEARAAAGAGSLAAAYLWALFTSMVQAICDRWRIRIGPYDGKTYQDEMIAQTDFRKFDGMLRTVLDVSPEEVERLESWLDEEYRAGHLIYGLHRDREALMTCLVFSLEASEHVHFIDAAGGGFAKAAEGFKARAAHRR